MQLQAEAPLSSKKQPSKRTHYWFIGVFVVAYAVGGEIRTAMNKSNSVHQQQAEATMRVYSAR